MRAVDALGISSSTLAIFTSDHGGAPKVTPRRPGGRSTSGLPRSNSLAHTRAAQVIDGDWRVEKNREPDILRDAVRRVPMLLRWPGRVPAGVTVAAPVSLVDVGPTLLEAALGASALKFADPASDGRSMLAVAAGVAIAWPLTNVAPGSAEYLPRAGVGVPRDLSEARAACAAAEERSQGRHCAARLVVADGTGTVRPPHAHTPPRACPPPPAQ